jgi:hypothetical protein
MLSGLRAACSSSAAANGRAFELYPDGVERVVAVEPDPVARAVAAERARVARVPIQVVAGTAESLPADDGSFDVAVVIWVLCSVDDPHARSGSSDGFCAPTGAAVLRARPFRKRGLPSRPARGRRPLLDACARGLPDDARHARAIGDAGFENRQPRTRIPLVSWLTNHVSPYVIGTARA